MDKNILEFITFAIGSVAERLQKSPSEIYKIFRQSNGFLPQKNRCFQK